MTQDLRNLGVILNKLILWLFFGTDNRMTISAWAEVHGPEWFSDLINRLYGDPAHTIKAAQGWAEADDQRVRPWWKILPLRIVLVLAVWYFW